jgi:hypothetical protein
MPNAGLAMLTAGAFVVIGAGLAVFLLPQHAPAQPMLLWKSPGEVPLAFWLIALMSAAFAFLGTMVLMAVIPVWLRPPALAHAPDGAMPDVPRTPAEPNLTVHDARLYQVEEDGDAIVLHADPRRFVHGFLISVCIGASVVPIIAAVLYHNLRTGTMRPTTGLLFVLFGVGAVGMMTLALRLVFRLQRRDIFSSHFGPKTFSLERPEAPVVGRTGDIVALQLCLVPRRKSGFAEVQDPGFQLVLVVRPAAAALPERHTLLATSDPLHHLVRITEHLAHHLQVPVLKHV